MGTYEEYFHRPFKSEWSYEFIPASNAGPRGISPTAAAYDEYHDLEELDLINMYDYLKELRQEMPSGEWDNEENN